MIKHITCISCPVGCRMEALVEEKEVLKVSGNACKRGETYARQEAISPMRMVTAVVMVKGSDMPLSVKTKQPIPKKDIAACMSAIEALHLQSPIRAGDVVLNNEWQVVATKSV